MKIQPFSFDLDIVGEYTGKQYKGKFTYRHPLVGERRKISSIQTQLNSEFEPNPEIWALNYAIAYMQVTLTEMPDWFKESKYGLDLEDEIVLEKIGSIIEEYIDKQYEDVAKQKAKEEKEKSNNESKR